MIILLLLAGSRPQSAYRMKAMPAVIVDPRHESYPPAQGALSGHAQQCRGFTESGRPEILVYRKTGVPMVPLNDWHEILERLEHAEKLGIYIEGRFKHADGSYRSAFHSFETLDQFESMISMHLGKLLAAMIEGRD
jgi:hypothetical protein